MGANPKHVVPTKTYRKKGSNGITKPSSLETGSVSSKTSASSKTPANRLKPSMFTKLQPRNRLTSRTGRTASRTPSVEDIVSNAPLHSQAKWQKKLPTLISGSLSEEDSEEESQNSRDAYNQVLGLVEPKDARKQKIQNLLLEEDSFTLPKDKKSGSEGPLIDVSGLTKHSDDEEDMADDSFLSGIKDYGYYERQRKETLKAGKENNWPETLDLEDLKSRTEKLIPELRAIITGKTLSYYHQKAESAMARWFAKQTGSKDPQVHRKRFGLTKNREGMSLKKVEQLKLPSDTGYYGSQGLEAIRQTLGSHLERDFTSVSKSPANDELWWLQYLGFHPYMLLVIVPEALSRLVAVDQCIGINEAREVVQKSTNYGLIKFPTQVKTDHIITHDDILGDSSDDDFFK